MKAIELPLAPANGSRAPSRNTAAASVSGLPSASTPTPGGNGCAACAWRSTSPCDIALDA